MRIKINTDGWNRKIIMVLFLLVCAAAKIFQLYYLPEKYFLDGKRILSEALSGYRSGDQGYDVTADFFSVLIRITGIDEYEKWSFLLGTAGSILLIYFVSKYLNEIGMLDFFFLCSSLFLMNIYTFNISKEAVQMLLLLPVIYILPKDCKKITKAVVTILSLLLTAVFLRSYFVLVAVLFLLIYGLADFSEKWAKQKIFFFLVILGITGLLGLYLLQRYMPLMYQNVISARNSINLYRMESADAETMIVDLIPNSSQPILYACNLCLNFIRICIPVSLLNKGMTQVFFCVYQLLFIVKLVRRMRMQSEMEEESGSRIAVALLLAFLIVSAVFEPDYGSVARHEMNFLPIMCIAFYRQRKGEEYEETSRHISGEFR